MLKLKKQTTLPMLLGLSLLLSSCTTSEKDFKDKLSKTLSENPGILHNAMLKDPEGFLENLQKTLQEARRLVAAKQKQEEEKALEKYFQEPLKPQEVNLSHIEGSKQAPVTIVEYTDFQCPFCAKGRETLVELQKTYGDKVRIVTKHLPLDFHPQALKSAKYFEAIRLQDEKLALAFKEEIFKSQGRLSNGEVFLKKLAKKLGIDIKRLEKDLFSKKIAQKIKNDEKEAQTFGFRGTPGYLVNGIPVKGALPPAHFHSLIEELQQRKLLTL